MAIFGKKKESKPVGVNASYYSGELTGFMGDDPVLVMLKDDILTITKAKVNVSLERSRIRGMEIFEDEKDYMLKYRGESGATKELLGKSLGLKKMYFVIRYTAKDGAEKRLDFWCNTLEGIRLMKLDVALRRTVEPMEYSI